MTTFKTKKEILDKIKEYSKKENYKTCTDLDKFLDKQKATTWEYHGKKELYSLLFNDYGAFLRVWDIEILKTGVSYSTIKTKQVFEK